MSSETKLRLGAADLFDLRFLRDANLSPDGKRVAYVVSRTDDVEHFDIFIADVASGHAERFAYEGDATFPRWSPDGRALAFVGDGRLRVAVLPSMDVSEPLTPETLTVAGPPSWSPDSARLVMSLVEHRRVEGPRRLKSKRYRYDGLGFLEDFRQLVYVIDPASRDVRCLTPDGPSCAQAEWSPCGKRILFLGTDHTSPLGSHSARVLTVEVEDGKITEVIAGDGWFVWSARWLPGGERIVVAGGRDSTLTVPALSIWVVDRDGGNPELRTPNLMANIGFYLEHDMPCWDLTQSNMLRVLDAKTLYATVQKGGCAEVWRIALEGEVAIERVLTGERGCVVLDVNATADILLFAVTDLRSPTELWYATLGGHRETRLTKLNDEVLARWPAVGIEHLVFESDDGMEIEAWFLGPVDRKGPLPTILSIHGGPFGTTGHAFHYDYHMLASQGYGLVFANFRGSTGYGEAHTRAIIGDWGGNGFPDHMATVDAAIARGLADPERLGVWGHSHGGFATCWIVGHTDRFRAAVAEAAVTNFATKYYTADLPEVAARDLGGKPHEIPDVYRSRSPITYAHRCTTPTMLLHGEDDLRCPMTEAEQFYRVLLDVGCTTELFRIPNCSHAGDSAGPLPARQAQNEALLDWFGRYL